MTLTYTIREVTTSEVVVDYSDNTAARIPLVPTDTRETILKRILQFSSERARKGFGSIEEVPVAVGETGVLQREVEFFTYADLRVFEYPTIGDQLDAFYWSRNGDTSRLEAIDSEITEVKARYPKDMAPVSQDQLSRLLLDE